LSQLICLGLSYKTASVELREQAALSVPQQESLLDLVAAGKMQGVAELVILATCNRLEFYVVGDPDTVLPALIEWLTGQTTLTDHELWNTIYCKAEHDAIDHLMRVAAGLESQIIGEPQILGQITRAYERASTLNAASATLRTLMQQAIHVGKRVRHETELSHGAMSISAVAAKYASRIAGSLNRATVLIIGAGEMARSAAASLVRRGVGRILIANRTLDHAQALAQQLGAQVVPFAELSQALIQADMVIAAAGAPHTLLHVLDVANVLPKRQGRPLLIFDIALPRNVAAGVEALPGVQLYNLDDLQADAETHRAERERAIPQAESIIAQEKQTFIQWRASRAVVPVIQQLRAQAEQVRQAEIEELTRLLPTLNEREQRLLEAYSRRLVNKLLHRPTLQLKAQSAAGQGELYASVVDDLFGLGVTVGE
jgi:glutamyl-tRNA reductase